MFLRPKANPAADSKIAEANRSPFAVLQVIDPARRDVLPPEGRDVGADNELYWQRRINEGSVDALSAEAGAKSISDADAARAKAAKAKAPAEKQS